MKIFVDNKLIQLTTKHQKSKFPFIEFNSLESIHKCYEALNESEIVFLYSTNKSDLIKKFISFHKLIEAAGGIVENEKGENLLIYRNGFWDLPKGKIEKNEKKKQAAIREVKEECGITDLELKEKIKNTYHIYQMGKDLILKKTYWYLMKSKNSSNLIPQTEEGIEKVEWVSKIEAKNRFSKSFRNLQDLYDFYLEKF